MACSTPEAYDLFHQGMIALSEVEANGMRVDRKYLRKTLRSTERKIQETEAELKANPIFRQWKREFGEKTKLTNAQLGHMVFEVLGFKRKEGNLKNDEDAFNHVDHPFVANYRHLQKLKKAHTTYLLGIQREVEGEYIHPNFNLHIPISFRSSSDHPNFQNWPVRNDEMAELIRRCFIARDGHQILEIDFKGIEVSVAACYTKDPVLISYVSDPTKDMHRDMAAQCFMLRKEQVTKMVRYCAKNMFVFPQFYGSVYYNCTEFLWEAIDRFKLETVDGMSVRKHLRKLGIREKGECSPDEKPVKNTFEHHIQSVEQDFWGRRFKVYADWKRRWFDAYLRTGSFKLLTGFVVNGVYEKNQVINCPVQGSAFHCLLWCLIRLQKMLRKKKMRSKIVGQIHDSMVCDVHEEEREEFLAMAKQVTTVDLRANFPWIIVPMVVEAELAPVGGSWFEKKGIPL